MFLDYVKLQVYSGEFVTLLNCLMAIDYQNTNISQIFLVTSVHWLVVIFSNSETHLVDQCFAWYVHCYCLRKYFCVCDVCRISTNILMHFRGILINSTLLRELLTVKFHFIYNCFMHLTHEPVKTNISSSFPNCCQVMAILILWDNSNARQWQYAVIFGNCVCT